MNTHIPELDSIPREHLISMLKDAVWYSGRRVSYGEHQGYSYDVKEETSLRDVLYRDEPLYKTPEEAILAHWKRHYVNFPVHTNSGDEPGATSYRCPTVDGV